MTYAPPPKLTTLSTEMSSRSSASDIWRRSQTSATGRRRPSRPAAISTDASVTSRAKRSGRIAPSREPRPSPSSSGGGGRGRRAGRGRRLAAMVLDDGLDALAGLAHELGRTEDARVVAEAQRPGDDQPRHGVVGDEHAAAVVAVAQVA